MKWTVKFLPEVEKDFASLSGDQRIFVVKAINKVCKNPLSIYEGGYGKPLGNKHMNNLTGLMKIKLKASGLRIVYKLIKTETSMLIVVIGMRSDDKVYQTAKKRTSKSVYAMNVLQKQMNGEAQRTGLTNEEDIVNLVKEIRSEKGIKI